MNGRPASLMRRIGAMVYDALLITALLFLATVPFIAVEGGESVESRSGALHIAYQLTLVAVTYVYFIGYWTRRGRTLGMQSWGMQLQTVDGGLPSLGVATKRYLAALLSWLPLGLGFLWQLIDSDKLTWHDHLSGTRLMHYPKQKKSG